MKLNVKFENYRNVLDATLHDNMTSYLEKDKINIYSIKKIISNSL